MSKEIHVLDYLKRNGYTTMTDGEASWWRGWYQCYQSKTLFYGWSLLPESDYKVRMELVMNYMINNNVEKSEPKNLEPGWATDLDIYEFAKMRGSDE